MAQDRDYYRSLTVDNLLLLAREEGINPEMAIAIAETLHSAREHWYYHDEPFEGQAAGHFQFNHAHKGDHP
jgi:hypothetical protein